MRFKRTLISVSVAMACLGAQAADYYVVTPVPGKTVSTSAIQVSLSQSSIPGGVVGTAYSYNFNQNLQVIGDPGYTGYGVKWSVASGALPAGLSLNTSTGVLSGTPTANGISSFVLNVSYKTKTGTQSYQIPVALAVSVSLNAGSLPQGVVGQAYSYNLKPLLTVFNDGAYNGSGVTWSVVSSTLPSGLYLTTDGYIGGTPTVSGSGSITVRAAYKGVNGEQTYQVVSLDIVVGLASASLPVGVTGVAYSGYDFKSLLSVTGDPGYSSGAVTWSVTSGALPAGLSLGSSGVVSGTPSAATTANFTLRAAYRNKTASQTYALQVDAASVTGALTAGAGSSFGTVTVGSSASRSFTFTNNGNATATGLYASVSGSGLSLTTPNNCGISGAPVSLAKGGSCTFTVLYTPTSAGTLAGAVAANWTGPNASNASLAVTGSATVDYSGLMTGYTRDAVAINRNAAWAGGQQWYWSIGGAEVSAPVGTIEFRRPITVSGSAPVTAYLYGAVDNTVESIVVNGTTIVTNLGMPFIGYSASTSFTLQPGNNVIAVHANNAGSYDNPAGFTLQVRKSDGTVLATESGWKF